MFKNKKVTKFMDRSINYSACNEDSNSEELFFQFQGNESLICLLGGGERFFNLLTYKNAPQNAVLLDANPSQKYLYELKRAAYKNLEYDEFCEFIGLKKETGSKRVSYYQKLKNDLSEEARDYWVRNEKCLEYGVMYQGNFEKFLSIMGKILSLFFSKTFELLFQADSLQEQKKIYEKHLCGVRWNMILKILCRKTWFKLLSKDPCFYMNEGVGNYYVFFKNMFQHAITEIPIKENFLLSLIFLGKYDFEEEVLPRCYRKSYYQQVRERLNEVNVSLEVSDLNSYLENTSRRFDCFSLSDVCSYLNEEEIKSLFLALDKVSNPKAKVVIRELMTRFNIDSIVKSTSCSKTFIRECVLEKEAKEKDSSFIWGFFFFNLK